MAVVFHPAVATGALLAIAFQLPSLDAEQRLLPEPPWEDPLPIAGSLRRPHSIDGLTCLPPAHSPAAIAAPRRHSPRRHSPRWQSPQGHNPEGHNPEGHNPRGHNPRGHNPEGHRPRGHSPEGQTAKAQSLTAIGVLRGGPAHGGFAHLRGPAPQARRRPHH